MTEQELTEQIKRATEALCSENNLVAEAENRRKVARESLNAIRCEYAALVFGLSVGAIIMDEKGKKHRVTSWGAADDNYKRWGRRPWVYANPQKKDGTYGTKVRNLYSDWTLVEH